MCFETSDVNEFKELNNVVSSLITQIELDFQNLKEFNENVSHEMQTPLAVMRNKMELLLESKNLDEREIEMVQATYRETTKLSKIGRSLALISKIENQEFNQNQNLNIKKIVEDVLNNFEEMIAFKKNDLKTTLIDKILILDPILANILFANLIKNAIQHNKEEGFIFLSLDNEKFVIENSGDVLSEEPEKLFKRFHKNKYSSESMGLGLAINRKICELYGFTLEYKHHEGIHRFVLFFSEL